MEQIISKEEFNNLMKLKGEVMGEPLKTTLQFILKEKGEEGLKKLEDTIAELGYPIKYRKIGMMDSYPLGLMAVTFLAIERLFNFDKEKFIEMGRFEAKVSSLLLRLYIKFFVSTKKLAEIAPKMWRRHFTVGNLIVTEVGENHAIIKVENFRLHPIHCQVLTGYIPVIVQMIGKQKVTCEETKCSFRGDEYHEFVVRW